MANPKNAAWYGGGLFPFLTPGAGNIWFVDGVNGANTNDGMGPDTAFLDITWTLANKCVAGNNDYIFVIEYPADGSPPAGETYPIAVNVNRVHIIGGAFAHGEADKFAFLGADTDDEIFSIQANWVEISYFKLAGGHSHAAIEFLGSGVVNKGFAIHHNHFSQKSGTDGQPLYSIWMETPNVSVGNWGYIAYNEFHMYSTSYAIAQTANPAGLRIHNNHFNMPAGIAIYENGGEYGIITNNTFSLISDTTGMAITCAAGAGPTHAWYIDGNRAHYGPMQMTQNPFRDLSGGQNWGLNYVGPAPTLPVTV